MSKTRQDLEKHSIFQDEDDLCYRRVSGYSTLRNDDGNIIGTQYPIPVNIDSIYSDDININTSDNYNFSGDVTDYFNSLESVNIDSTSNNPKLIKILFKRSTQIRALGFGCDDLTKSFSNIVIKALGSGGEVRYTKDLSTDSTERNSFVVRMPLIALNGVIIEFHTSNEIGLSNLILFKSLDTHATISATRDDEEVIDIGATNNNNLKVSVQEYGDTPSVDAFARLRVSENYTIFDSKQLHDKQPIFWDEIINGDATSVHSTVNADTVMGVSSAGDYVIRQTKQRFNYQPGKSQLAFMTFHAPISTSTTKRIGLFDGTGTNNLTPYNGIFFEVSSKASWNIAKDGTTTETVTQENWNVDKLDGSGPSEIILDLDSAHIAIVDFEWLGVGRVRAGFVIDGLIYYVHKFNHANDPAFNSVYMSTPNLPLRYDIQTDSAESTNLSHICSTIVSEGGLEKTGVLRCVDTSDSGPDGLNQNVTYAILAIRLKDAYKDVTILPEYVSVINEANDDFRWSLHLNPTIEDTFTYTDITNSAVQWAQGTEDNVITDEGLKIGSGYASIDTQSANQQLNTALKIGSTIAGVQDTLVLAVRPLSNGAFIQASLNFRELL